MKNVLAIDIGGTNVRMAIVSNDLNITNFIKENTIINDFNGLKNQIIRMIKSLPLDKYNVKDIGISLCGIIEDDVLLYAPNLHIKNFKLKEYILNEFPDFNVKIVNDANCTAYSEAIYGSGKNYNNVIFLTISTGIGGGVVLNKKLVNASLEIGSMLVNYQDKLYPFETLFSGNGLIKLCELNNLNIKDTVEFFSLINKNETIDKIFSYWKDNLALYIYNLQAIFNVDCFIVSGGVLKSKDLFLDDIIKKTNELIKYLPLKPIKMVLSEFDQNAGILGASSIVLND